jgi:hypothetical protein
MPGGGAIPGGNIMPGGIPGGPIPGGIIPGGGSIPGGPRPGIPIGIGMPGGGRGYCIEPICAATWTGAWSIEGAGPPTTY